jgi:hypothetical protein
MMANKVKLRLIGLDGNAFILMGAFANAAKRQGWNKEEIEAVLTDCRSGDYDHLLCVLMANTEDPNPWRSDSHDDEGDNDDC